MSSRPLGYCVSQVDSPNTGSREQNLLSLSYGNIIQKDIAGSDGLLPESFETYNVVEPGDTVLRLTDLQNDQRSLRVGFVQERGIITSAYVTLRPKHDVDPRFFSYVLKSMDFRKDFYALGAGVRQSLKFDELKRVQIHLPAIEKQRAIADYLDTETARIDALITKKQRIAQFAYERWRSHLVTALGPHLAHGSVPDGWRFGRLKNLVDSIVNGSWGDEPGSSHIEAPCVRAADFNFRKLVATTGATRSYESSDYAARFVSPGEFVLEKSGGGDEAPVGRVVMWQGDGFAVPTNFAARMKPLPKHDPWFVLLAFRAAYEAQLNWKAIKQTTGIQNLDSLAFLSERWPIPPIDAQQLLGMKIRKGLDSVVALVDKINSQVTLLREHRQALITAAVTGDLEVPGVAA